MRYFNNRDGRRSCACTSRTGRHGFGSLGRYPWPVRRSCGVVRRTIGTAHRRFFKMLLTHGSTLSMLAAFALGGCASSGDDDALPMPDRYERKDVQQIASSLLANGEYHNAFGLEIRATNVRLLSDSALLLQSSQDGTAIF